MLTQAIGGLLPSAIGVALSPVPIIAVIIMLGTPRAGTNGPAFAVGWVIGLVVVATVVLALAGGASDPASATATGVGWFDVVAGVVFFVMAARQWRRRPAPGEAPELPKWMATVDTFTPPRAGILGAALSGVNPKNLALTVAAAASIAQTGASGGGAAGAVAVFVVLASLTVLGPVVAYLTAPARMAAPLGSLKQLMADHNAVIMMVVLVVLGAKLLGAGLGGLAR